MLLITSNWKIYERIFSMTITEKPGQASVVTLLKNISGKQTVCH